MRRDPGSRSITRPGALTAAPPWRCWRKKGTRFEDIDVTDDEIREREMIERAHVTSVPQIFVDGESIGGYYDLAALDAHGLLDGLLGGDKKLPRAA